MTEEEMVGLDGHGFENALGDGEEQGSLACCSPWGRKELDMTEQQHRLIIRINIYNTLNQALGYRKCYIHVYQI